MGSITVTNTSHSLECSGVGYNSLGWGKTVGSITVTSTSHSLECSEVGYNSSGGVKQWPV